MQRVELSSSFRMLIFFVGGSLLGGALVRFPLNPFDGRIWLYRSPTSQTNPPAPAKVSHTARYRLEPLFGHSSYLRGNSSSLLVAGVFYMLLLIAGLLTMRIVRKHATRPVKTVN